MQVTTRFCPSPSGHLHIGGARTALFNWLLARHGDTSVCEGQHRVNAFRLRIEDTDQQRCKPEYADSIRRDLEWLGLDWDGEVFCQSQRRDEYDRVIARLIAEGKAYCAFETPEELDAQRKAATAKGQEFRYQRPELPESQVRALLSEKRTHVVRYGVGKSAVRFTNFNDAVLGTIQQAEDQQHDFIIRRSDGWPTYHLAVVVDDIAMGVNCVLRGQEHLLNTFNHLYLYEALGAPSPRYAHLPVILNLDGSKMSKRNVAEGAEITIADFRRAGYLPGAVLNAIVLLGWNPESGREELSIQEMTEQFSLYRVGKANARFDRAKLAAFNTSAIKRPAHNLKAFKDFLGETDSALRGAPDDLLGRILELNVNCRTFKEVNDKSAFLRESPEQIRYPDWSPRERETLRVVTGVLCKIGPGEWKEEVLDRTLRDQCASLSLPLREVVTPIRLALTGRSVSPPLTESMVILGHGQVLNRLRLAIERESAQKEKSTR